MDLGRVFALLVATASGLFLYRFLSESWRGNLGWKSILALLLAASVAGGLVIAAMTVHLAGPWVGFHHTG